MPRLPPGSGGDGVSRAAGSGPGLLLRSAAARLAGAAALSAALWAAFLWAVA